ncbi:haloacid dehalogenase (HAD) -like hydrolase/Phosphoserine phosphatase [Candidatus Vidania fulgoroideae]|nr:haloacid dehalogenase (HAD) -like hydrolase/Phosphoserine phosphatase [Candidatus Vidania fulgoroideae]
MKKILSVFDMDKTITRIDCEMNFYRFLYGRGKIKKKDLRGFINFHEGYKKNNFDSRKHLKFQNKVIKKRKLFKLRKSINFFIKKIIKRNLFNVIFNKLIKRKRSVISTSSNVFLAKKIIEKLFKVPFLSTNIKNKKKGFKTSNFGKYKLLNLKRWMKKNDFSSYDIEFFTDSITDLPLLKKAKYKILVNPNREFIKETINLKNIKILLIK